jgi:hypothetical protein
MLKVALLSLTRSGSFAAGRLTIADGRYFKKLLKMDLG